MDKKGFTLIEPIVVIAILSVIGLLLVGQISGYIESTKTISCQNNRKLVKRSLIITEGSEGTKGMSLEQLSQSLGSMYKGGKVCPDGNENITITN